MSEVFSPFLLLYYYYSYNTAYTISLNLIFLLFEDKNEEMLLHCAETDEITTGVINNLKNVDAVPAQQLCFVCGNFGFYCKTISFQTARTIEGSNMCTDHIT